MMKTYRHRIIGFTLCLVLLLSTLATTVLASEVTASGGIPVYKEKEVIFDTRTPTALITLTETAGEYTLLAERYTYASDAASLDVAWTPIALILPDGETSSFVNTGDEYTATFAYNGELETLSVVYAASFFVADGATPYATLMTAYASATARSLVLEEAKAVYEEALLAGEAVTELSYTYQKAKLSYEGELAAYKAAKRAYDEAHDGYRAYTAYESAKEKYDAYLAELALYEADLGEYNDYLKDLADYEAAVLEHERKVEAYGDAYERMQYHLSLIDIAKTKMTDLERTLHGAITGSVVQDMVLGSEGDIVAEIGSGALVELAGEATRTLIHLFDGVKDRVKVGDGYFDMISEREKYTFYITNYENFANAYLQLFQALEALYRVNAVRAGIMLNQKLPQYLILLAQLHLVCNLLHDEPIYNYEGTVPFDETWTVKSENALVFITAQDILGDEYTKHVIDQDLAQPLPDGYPVAPGDEPEEPAVVADPGQPPRVVAEPTPVPVVQYPGGEFTEPPLSQNTLDLSDRAPERTDISEILAASEEDSLALNYSGATLLFDEQTVADLKGHGVVAVEPVLTEEEYSIVFRDEDGNTVEVDGETKVTIALAEISHDARLTYLENDKKCYQSFALYDNKLTFYAKTGVVYRLRNEYSTYIASSQMLTLSADKVLAEAGERVTLTPELLPGVQLERILVTDADGAEVALDENNSFFMVEGGVRVLAVATYINYKVTFTVAGKTLFSETYTYGEMPEVPSAPIRADEGRLRYTFSHWSPSVVAVTEDAVYDAVFNVELLPEVQDDGSSRPILLWIIFGSIGAVFLFVLLPLGIYMVIRIRRKRG